MRAVSTGISALKGLRWTSNESVLRVALAATRRSKGAMIGMLFAAAVALFVLSLPIHMTKIGAALRRAAGFCFVAALLPSLILGLFFPGVRLSFTEHPIGMTFALLFAIGIAYGVYELRKWLHADPAKKQLRLPEKTPIERSRRQQDLFAFFADNQPPEEPRP
jgi:hypothetical protein